MNPPTASDKINEFFKLIDRGIKAWTDAGKVLCDMVDADPACYESIIARSVAAGVPIKSTQLVMFEQIGRGHLSPRMLLATPWIASKLKHMPPEEQDRMLTGSVRLVTRNNGTGFREKSKRVEDLSPAEAGIVFDEGKVRQPAEQIEVLQAKDAKRRRFNGRYVMEDGAVLFLQDCRLTWSELEELLERHALDAESLEKSMKAAQIPIGS